MRQVCEKMRHAMNRQPKLLVFLFAYCAVFLFSIGLQAQNCTHVPIATLPFSESSTTCGAGNEYTNNNICGAWFLTGEDITYGYTTTDESCLFLELSGYEPGAAGVVVTTECPYPNNGDCVNSTFSAFNATSLETSFATQPNTTYYITISTDNWNASCTDYDFSLSTNCPDPTTGDCLGAVNICVDYYYEENAPDGSGTYVDDIAANSCGIGAVDNVGWYTFTTQTAGILNFTLSPLETDDYDWALFNITDATCADLATDESLLVSCNTYGEIGNNGDTGISTALGGTGSANGPGNLNGPPFNADVNVVPGETYALLVSNWSGTTNGYELDFGASTATFIDDVNPEVESVSASCNGLMVQFSEYVDCETALPEYFNVESGGDIYEVTTLESSCSNGSFYGLTFLLSFDTPFPADGGDFNLIFEADEIADLCGNFVLPISIPFEVPSGMTLESISSPASCGNATGTIEVNITDGGLAPFEYQLDGGLFQPENIFDNLAAGTYTITARDDGGCLNEIILDVETLEIEFSAGVDAYTCQFQYTAQATVPLGFTGLWSGPATITMSDDTNPNCVSTAATAGNYTLTWTISNGSNCTLNQSIDVVFNQIEIDGFSFTQPACIAGCDASAEVTIGGVADITEIEYDWSGGFSSPASPDEVQSLCVGMQLLTVTTLGGCQMTHPFEIENPTGISFDNVVVTPETCPGFCDGAIAIESELAIAYSFDSGQTFGGNASKSNLCSGSYRVLIQNESLCELDTVVHLILPPGPQAQFSVQTQRKSTFDPDFSFENESQNYISSLWQFDYPGGADRSHDDSPDYKFYKPEPKDYTVMLVVKDTLNCVDTTFRDIGIYEDTWIYIPNSFTPNGDGINDIFKPSLLNADVADYSFIIFDRWGAILFETTDVDEGWNGEVNQTDFYAGVDSYVYRIHIREAETNEPREWNGFLIMVR